MSRGDAPRETTAATSAGWVEEATCELSPAAWYVCACAVAAERSLLASLPVALSTHRMDLLTVR